MKRRGKRRRRGGGRLAAGIGLVALAAAAVPLGYYGHRIWPAISGGNTDPSATSPSTAGEQASARSSSRVARLVDDEAAILDQAQTQRLAQLHARLLRQHDIDLRVVTVEGAEPIDRATLERYVALRVGSLSKRHRGLLLLVDAHTRIARLRLGPELRKTYPEPFVTFVETELLLPYFQNDRIAEGVIAAAEWVRQRTEDAAAKRPFVRPENTDPKRPLPPPGQRNATPGAAAKLPPADRVAASRTSPAVTFRRYLAALAHGDGRPELPIYSKRSQRFLAAQSPSKAQMKAVVDTYARCPAPKIKRKRDRAVLRFPKRKRRCAPYFLRREAGAWRLDLDTMSRVVRYNHRGQWHLARGAEHAYGFAFRDWRFDYYGFPR